MCGWPKDETPKSKALPMLQIQMAPPENYMPEVQAEIKRLNQQREEKQFKYMESIQKAYEEELKSSGGKIKAAIDDALKVFDDEELFTSSIRYAMQANKVYLPESQRNAATRFVEKTHTVIDPSKIDEKFIHKNLLNLEQEQPEYTSSITTHSEAIKKPLTNNQKNIKRLELLTKNELINQDRQSTMFRKSSFSTSIPNKTIPNGPLSFRFVQKDDEKSLPPVLVKLFNTKPPDAKIQSAMDDLEKGRDTIEQALFKKAELEMKLISEQTLDELKQNIEQEIQPFKMAKDGAASSARNIVAQNKRFRFMEKDIVPQLLRKTKYNKIRKQIKKINSFLQLKQGGDDSINVKLSTSDSPYPTIYKLIAEMEAKRDLSEKFERLKILEFYMNLQKALDEMIKDALHVGLTKVMSKYGPAIEGAQESMRLSSVNA